MNTTLAAELVPLADELDKNKVTPGVLGFIVFALLGVAVWFLLKSMNRHLGKVDFKEKTDRGGGSAGGEGAPRDGTPRDDAPRGDAPRGDDAPRTPAPTDSPEDAQGPAARRR